MSMTVPHAGANPLDVLKGDVTAFSKVLERLLESEMASFQGFSGQYGLYEDAAAILDNLRAGTGAIIAGLDSVTITGLPLQARLVDAQFDELDRLVTVAELRGAANTSGDLLAKLHQWIALLRGWVAAIERQLEALAA
ncbi:MAG: hypothetical protein ACK4Z0_02595 [Sphingomonadaceae bacterium]